MRSRLSQTPDDVSLRCLLWRHLERRGAHAEAARVLEHLATTPCPHIDINDRIEYLSRALVIVKALTGSR
ncbi:unnamed protein product [Protopolystoma xenopodis]|uniref:Nucleoporin Nup133/Nup155-like C-terminal domain-containing protein n=1 Tax=Protopolystoma xenopodis TaxID=117903 RepID=A0A448WVW8_9PLAT|nr:unnamed protein product [Protopolystoma xenopodis]